MKVHPIAKLLSAVVSALFLLVTVPAHAEEQQGCKKVCAKTDQKCIQTERKCTKMKQECAQLAKKCVATKTNCLQRNAKTGQCTSSQEVCAQYQEYCAQYRQACTQYEDVCTKKQEVCVHYREECPPKTVKRVNPKPATVTPTAPVRSGFVAPPSQGCRQQGATTCSGGQVWKCEKLASEYGWILQNQKCR